MIDVLIRMPKKQKKFPRTWVDYGRKKRFESFSWKPTTEKQKMGRIPFNILTEEVLSD